MEHTTEELLVLKASLICMRDKLYGVMTSLNITMNNTALSGIKTELDMVDSLIDKIDHELKKQ